MVGAETPARAFEERLERIGLREEGQRSDSNFRWRRHAQFLLRRFEKRCWYPKTQMLRPLAVEQTGTARIFQSQLRMGARRRVRSLAFQRGFCHDDISVFDFTKYVTQNDRCKRSPLTFTPR